MKATVSEKGQLTIPKLLRDRLGIRAGQIVDLEEERGRIVLTKADETDAVERAYGLLSGSPPTDEIITTMRGKPDAL